MPKVITYEQALLKATQLCSKSEHCKSEITDKLFAWGISDRPTQEKILDYLEENNYLDEKRYARAFCNDKLRYQGWGRRKIQMMLQMKKLPEYAIDEAIGDIDESIYVEVLQKALKQKLNSLPETLSAREQAQKILQFLMQRGFLYEEISKQISSLSLPSE